MNFADRLILPGLDIVTINAMHLPLISVLNFMCMQQLLFYGIDQNTQESRLAT